MPRYARQVALSGIYHVMARGNERKNIFLDKNDKIAFLKRLFKAKLHNEFFLYAFCLMNNHFHLLLKENKEELSHIMASLNISYASYFNKKYDRVGHLFQDRFRSEAVENDAYLLTAVRYIHNNPVKANIVDAPQGYLWSSYRHYFYNHAKYKCLLVDRDFILNIFSDNRKQALRLFASFNCESNEDRLIDCHDNDVNAYIKSYVDKYLAAIHQPLAALKEKDNIAIRNELIRQLRQKKISIRQIACTLAVNRNIIQRVK